MRAAGRLAIMTAKAAKVHDVQVTATGLRVEADLANGNDLWRAVYRLQGTTWRCVGYSAVREPAVVYADGLGPYGLTLPLEAASALAVAAGEWLTARSG
jgi:hypothetical protein